jgi:hypothetical protein
MDAFLYGCSLGLDSGEAARQSNVSTFEVLADAFTGMRWFSFDPPVPHSWTVIILERATRRGSKADRLA